MAILIVVAGAFWWKAGKAARAAKVGARESPTKLSFNEHVRPILSANCYYCHGQDAHSRQAELRLDREEFAFAPRKGGPAIVRGQPDKSPLVLRIESTNPSEIMPAPGSHKVLKEEEVALLRRWVQEGAAYEF